MYHNKNTVSILIIVLSLIMLALSAINISSIVIDKANVEDINNRTYQQKDELRLMKSQIKSYDKSIKEKSDEYNKLKEDK